MTYIASSLVIESCENGFIITLSAFDSHIRLVAQDREQLLEILQDIEFKTPRPLDLAPTVSGSLPR